jgi:hypothetical protein
MRPHSRLATPTFVWVMAVAGCSFSGGGLDAPPPNDAEPPRACSTDAECSSVLATPRCDVVAGHCVACVDTSDCASAEAPVCSPTHECLSCGAAADCARFADRPLCDGSSGECVACVGSEQCAMPHLPVCDDGLCRACEQDSECVSGVCNEADGSCVPEDNIIYVDPTGAAGECLRTMPCATITQGLAQVEATRSTILVLPKTGGYKEQLAIQDKSLTIIGTGAELGPPPGDSGPVVTVLRSTVLVIEGLQISGATTDADRDGDGISCQRAGGDRPMVTLRAASVAMNARRGIDASECTLVLDRATLTKNSGGGLVATGGTQTIERTTVSDNAGGGIAVEGSLARVSNSVFLGNGTAAGTSATLFGGVHYERPLAGSLFDFNTVSNNFAGGSNPRGVRCTVVVGSVALSNSIVVGSSANQISAECLPQFLLSNQDLAGRGTGNQRGTPTFTSDGFHLASGSAGIDAANPSGTSPAVDFDGEPRPRPEGEGSGSDIGADEVVP